MILRVLAQADAEAISAQIWYEDQQPGLGRQFLQRFQATLEAIEANPRRHPKVEFEGVRGEVRRVLMRRFPYLVVYEVLEEEAIVLAVSHAKRDQSYWKRRVSGE